MRAGIRDWIVIIIVSVAAAFVLWGPSLNARFGIIDDHDIIALLGPDLKVGLAEAPSVIAGAMDRELHLYYRCRPTAILFKVAEAVAWGNSPFLWYASRLLQFAIFVALFCYFMKRLVPLPIAVLFCLYNLADPYWGDVWSRLGPSENYAAIGLALYCVAAQNLSRRMRRGCAADFSWTLWRIDWVLLAAGTLLAAGSKENFTFLLAGTLVLAGIAARNRLLDDGTVVTSLGIATICPAAILAWVGQTKIRGQLGAVLADALQIASQQHDRAFVTAAIIGVVLLFSTIVFARWQIRISRTSASRSYSIELTKRSTVGLMTQNTPAAWRGVGTFIALLMVVEVVFGLIYLTQYIFYSGKLPYGGRYDFPATLAIRGALFAPIVCMFLVSLNSWQQFTGSRWFRGVLILGFLGLIWAKGFGYARYYVAVNVESTTRFNAHVERVVHELKARPAAPLVLVSHSVWDYEPLFAAQRYLEAYGVRNSMFLLMKGYSSDALTAPIEKDLARMLEGRGNNDSGPRFQHLTKLPGEETGCFSLGFSGDPRDSIECVSLGEMWPLR